MRTLGAFSQLQACSGKTAADESAVQELAGLMGVADVWWTRNAVTMPVYAANPMFALKTALDKHEALTKEFARKNNLDPNFVYVLDAARTLARRPKLQDLGAGYQRLDEFLESAVQPQCATLIFAVNKSLSNIGLYLGLDTSYGKDTYVIMTEPALGVTGNAEVTPTGACPGSCAWQNPQISTKSSSPF